MRKLRASLSTVFLSAIPALILCSNGTAADSAAVKKLLRDLPVEYSTAPLWVFSDMVTEKMVISTIRDLAAQNVRQVFIHPRPAMITPYMSQQWFRLWETALEQAKLLDMKVWIYDENSYPSGFAGGFVPEAMPSSRGMGLHIENQDILPQSTEDTVAAWLLDGERYENVTGKIGPDAEDQGDYLVASIKRAQHSPWFGGFYYVNLLTPGVTEKFLELTLDPYKSRFGAEFGRTIPGVFTDEPHVKPADGLPWAAELPRQFRKRWGYSLTENLQSLKRPAGDFKKIRHNYWQLVLDLFIERWSRPYYQYCEKHNLELTGHYWEHMWPQSGKGPDNMAMYAWHQRPAIDTLFYRYAETPNAQFGNVRAVKELSSVANQLGKKRTLCEAYGGSGWQMRFKDLKRFGDWLYVLGVNTLDQHLSYISIRGGRKMDYPPSFSYHQPWWDAYHVLADYFWRLSAALSQGDERNAILVIEPTTTAWMYDADETHRDRIKQIGDTFQQLVTDLSKAQVEYDIGCEKIIADHGSIEGELFAVGRRRYKTVVLPPHTENLNGPTAELLESFADSRGTVFCCGRPPTRIDGAESDRLQALPEKKGFRQTAPETLPRLLANADGFTVTKTGGGLLFHHRRRIEDGQLMFLVNTSIDEQCHGTVKSNAGSVEKWDIEAGLSFSSYPYKTAENGIETDFSLEPCGSLLLFLADTPGAAPRKPETKSIGIAAKSGVKISRLRPNVLVIDYMDVAASGRDKAAAYWVDASNFAFETHGFKSNPWEHQVQFRDNLVSRTFNAASYVEATYTFIIEDSIPPSVKLVIERPDLYSVTCNGATVWADENSWWLDRSFGVIDIRPAVGVGKNTVTIKASPFSMLCELAAAYIIGDFSLRPADSGFFITPPEKLELGPWKEQGMPLYSHEVSYKQTFAVPEPSGRYYVRLADWNGSVAEVTANGKAAGYIWHSPWDIEVTESVKAGDNEIEVVVYGTLKNTLGPHHNDPQGITSPGNFRQAPENGPPAGEKYLTIGYGLFEPFELIQVKD